MLREAAKQFQLRDKNGVEIYWLIKSDVSYQEGYSATLNRDVGQSRVSIYRLACRSSTRTFPWSAFPKLNREVSRSINRLIFNGMPGPRRRARSWNKECTGKA
jgi:hypothetical protein